MTAFDIALFVILIGSAVFGYMRGLVHEVLSIAGWVGAAFATIHITPLAKPFVMQVIDDDAIAGLVGGILIFILTLVIVSLGTRTISKRVKDSALGALDRALGFLFGILRGAVIASLAFIVYASLVAEDDRGDWVIEAKTLPWVELGSDVLASLVPDDGEPPAEGDPKAGDTPPEPGTLERTKMLFERATTPTPEQPAETPPGGYDNQERKELDRLFETNQ